jgi:hypothetical protein
MYIKDLANHELIERVRKKIREIKADNVWYHY